MASAGARAYIGVWVEPPAESRGRAPGGRSGAIPPPEAESSVAFEAPVEEPN